MNQFDTFMDKARNVADAASKKTTEIVQLSRLKLEESQLHNDIDREYRRLGSAVYQMTVNNAMDQKSIDKLCDKLTILLYNLSTIEEQINALKKNTPCPACGCPNPSKSSYCSQCGAQLHPFDPSEPDELEHPI